VGQSVLILCNKGGNEGAAGEIWKTIESVKIVSVYLICQNNKKRVALIMLIIALQFGVSTSCNEKIKN